MNLFLFILVAEGPDVETWWGYQHSFQGESGPYLLNREQCNSAAVIHHS